MRRSFVAIACLLILSLNVWLVPAIAQEATPAATPDGVASPAADCVAGTEESNVEVVNQWYEVWGTDDDASLEDLVQPDIIHYWGVGEDTFNVADLRARTHVFASAFSDLQTSVDEVIADGDYVAVHWTLTATQTGPFFDLEPSGVRATWTGINIFRFECGKIAESWNESDQVGLRAQLTGMTDPIVGTLATPAVNATPAADCAPTSEQDAADVATRWEAVWNAGDVSLYDELAPSDLTHHWGAGQDTTSREEFKDRMGAFFTAFPDLRLTQEEPLVDGDLAAIRWTFTGTQTGPIFGFEPTGAEITTTGINIFRIECGQVVETWSEVDSLGFRAQLEAATEAGTPAA